MDRGRLAIEAFTQVPRRHDDLDPSIPRSDVAALHQHLAGRLDLWQAHAGSLRPMVNPQDPVPATCGNLWLRASGADPWEYDVLLMNATATTWTYKRDARITLPVKEMLWVRDDISYLRPEVQLLHKAPGPRQKDQADFDSCLTPPWTPGPSLAADRIVHRSPGPPVADNLVRRAARALTDFRNANAAK